MVSFVGEEFILQHVSLATYFLPGVHEKNKNLNFKLPFRVGAKLCDAVNVSGILLCCVFLLAYHF